MDVLYQVASARYSSVNVVAIPALNPMTCSFTPSGRRVVSIEIINTSTVSRKLITM